MNLMQTLRRKLGPLPVWVYMLAFIAIMTFYFIRRRKAQEAAAAAAAQAQANDAQANTDLGTNLGTNSLSNLVPTAYPMPFQQGDVFVNTTVPPPATTGTATAGTGTSTTQKPATPAGPKYPNQIHRVGEVGRMYDLRSYISALYPGMTPQQWNEVEFATIVDPRNKQYNLGTGKIPGGAEVEFYSKAIK